MAILPSEIRNSGSVALWRYLSLMISDSEYTVVPVGHLYVFSGKMSVLSFVHFLKIGLLF